MEAKVSARFPEPPGWAYEPKWDGFRALAWSGSPGAELPGAELPGDEPRLDSRNRRPLLCYFPELVPALEALPEATVVEGEVIVVIEDATDFEALQQRIHPAASRIARLAAETPRSSSPSTCSRCAARTCARGRSRSAASTSGPCSAS